MIRLCHISKSFEQKLILKDVNLEIEDGIIMGLIGANGAGKSTLLRLMAGIYQCDLGHVYMDSEDVFDCPIAKCDILLISDEPFYFFNATLKQMKEFYQTWYPKLDQEVYSLYLHQFHLDENEPLNNFSKGMLRQAFLIIGLAIAPRYLLLDEAFDGLDPLVRAQFKQAIAQRIEANEMSVIISSHDLKEMQDLCDTYAMLDHGCLKTSGNVLDTIEQAHKFQVAFSEIVLPEWFAQLDVLSMTVESRVVNLVVRGDVDKIETYLRSLQPVLFEVLPVSLEEIFIYEIERKGGFSL